MADELTNKTISKNNTGFPDYLDFTKLRSAAIEYLGKLSGKIWTDHNVHDPGITILESLIYALLDLGYRTNLPAADLFTRNPSDNSKDNNFFTPSEILGNNPLTITDYRKLLVDITGVKNAWLEIDQASPVVFCPDNNDPAGAANRQNPCDCEVLNGLYHVYIQLEKEFSATKHKKESVINKVRKALMAHRNLCEDFIDIQVLCDLEIGLCVEIELDEGADPEDVYVKMVGLLEEYFSPSPTFYSLQQLLDKNKSIDEIFAGRPFDTIESHGFIDTNELEQLPLRKELHLSDVYPILFDIEGVRNIRNLGWITCCDDKKSVQKWKLQLPKNYVPSFSTSCSGITFTRNGLLVNADLKKFESFFELKRAGSQKASYTEPSSFLDPEFPKGIYRSDLAEYYSIQNDFPKVYGIAEGSLPSSVSVKRKAQALQLQGFLLFFDQLLANYLTQLKNMRSLFAMSSSKVNDDNHTYFINHLTDSPELQKLLRFRNEPGANNSLGGEGSILAYPTDRKKIQQLIDTNTLQKTELERKCNDELEKDFPEYTFCFAAEREQAVNQLKDDLLFGEFEPVIVANNNDCWFFYIMTSSPDFVIISKKYYSDSKSAADAAASVRYIATFSENYRSFMATCCENNQVYFSFDIDFNLDAYAKYLQLIVEDKQLYSARRQEFLTHLLSRFAERFTDFALLSAPFLSRQELLTKQISAEENFLRQYPGISSTRGKGYDYLKDKWGNYNISGFEKRFKALAGIDNWKRHYLCNFVVEKGDALYRLSITFFDQSFAVDNKIVKEEEALASFHSVYKKLADPVFQLRYITHEQKWQVFVRDDFGNQYGSEQMFEEKQDAIKFSNTLASVFNFRPEFSRDIFVSKFIYKDIFTDNSGKIIAESKEHFLGKEDAGNYNRKVLTKMVTFLNNPAEFVWISSKAKLDKLLVVSGDQLPFVFIDEQQFIFKDTDFIHLKEEKKKFSALNKNETIQFDSINKYDNIKLAKDGYRRLLTLLSASSNYSAELNKQTETYEIFVNDKGEKLAIYFDSFSSPELARKKIQELTDEIGGYTYKLYTTNPIPDEWEFKYRSEDLSGHIVDYTSRQHYRSADDSWKSATQFYSNIPSLKIKTDKNQLVLTLSKEGQPIRCVADVENPDEKTISQARQTISFSQELFNKVNNPGEDVFRQLLINNRVNIDEDYVYKLVDKDNMPAACVTTFASLLDAEKTKNDLILRAAAGYNYVDIAIAGDIIHEIKDIESKAIWYHYRIQCNNRKYGSGPKAGRDLVLFESTRGFASREDALKGFNENYLAVLKYARFANNYGPGQFISLEELLVHSNDACDNRASVVFVPKNTLNEFGGYEVQKELIPIAASYPIRYIRKNKYAFIIGQLDEQTKSFNQDWKSRSLYRTAEESMGEFQFFLVLLKYGGNFFVEWDPAHCGFHIYIREVLAISAHGFAKPENAWGAAGVEKFICTAQSKNGFHNYLNRLSCANSFFVACGNAGLVHPCVYETPGRRDAVLNDLYKSSSFNFFELLQIQDNEIIVHNVERKPVARILTINRNLNFSRCDWLVAFFESVFNDGNYVKVENSFQLNYRFRTAKQETYYKLAVPYDNQIKLKDWKQQLQKIACYFPIVRKEDPCGSPDQKKYFVEIKLPGVGCCDDDCNDPCCSPTIRSSPCQEPGCKICCYAAWISDCCFDNCCDALSFYARSLLLLANYENYKPVYDCSCNSYRIGLYPQLSLKEEREFPQQIIEIIRRLNTVCNDNNDPAGANRIGIYRRNPFHCLNEIVAINPQQYNCEAMACAAVARAKRCINSEGLHLVEHILLRPRCKNADGRYVDCECDGLPQPCMDGSLCHFEWKPGGDPDPCEEEKTICFVPGCDPYSFIATVALPAWPERFRSSANKKLVEKLLQREAPAHVLLRILWLNPRDFCCFEYYFKLWSGWLGQKLCAPYSNCDFLKFIFKKRYLPLPDCDACQPCSCSSGESSCFEQVDDPCANFNLTDKLNQLFCWAKSPEYDYTHCEPVSDIILLENRPQLIRENIVREEIQPRPAGPDIAETALIAEVQPAVEKAAVPDRKEKFKLVQSRAHSYETHIRSVIEDNPDNKVAANALIFLKKSKPTPEEYIAFAEEVVKDKSNKSKKIKGLSKADKQVIIQNITWKYLDSVCFNGKDIDKILALKDTLALLQKNKIDTRDFYDKWEAGKVKDLEPSIDFKKIRNLMHAE